MSKVTLSDTQTRVISSVGFVDKHMITGYVKGANAATYNKLYTLGLISANSSGAALTERGLSVWASLQSDPTTRRFFLLHREEINHTPYVVKDVEEAHCAMHDTGVSKCKDMHAEDDGGFMETNPEEF